MFVLVLGLWTFLRALVVGAAAVSLERGMHTGAYPGRVLYNARYLARQA